MSRRTIVPSVVALLFVAAVALVAPLGTGQSTAPVVAINVVEAEDLGCSDDVLAGQADLQVNVRVNGDVALETVKAQDRDEPYYAAYVVLQDVRLPAAVSIEVREAEPGGFLGLGTSWKTCDVSPRDTLRHEFSWDGTDRVVETKGNEPEAARVVVVFGEDAPVRPVATVSGVTHDSAVVAWDAGQGETGHRVRLHAVGDFLASGGPGAGSAILDELCENTAYRAYVVRDAAPWHISSEAVAFTTVNVAPEPPRILEADATNGSLEVVWESPIVHDVARFELHAGKGDFEPDGTTLVETYAASPGPQPFAANVTAPGAATHVKVRTVDTGGLSATSTAWRIGDPARESELGPDASGPCHGPLVPPGPPAQPGTVDTPVQPEPAQDAGGHAGQADDPIPAEQGASPPEPEPEEGGLTSQLWLGILAGIVATVVVIGIVAVVRGQ